jgi:hypothetical protein
LAKHSKVDYYIRWLVRRGTNVNAVNHWGQIPLHVAIESPGDDIQVISYLVIKIDIRKTTREFLTIICGHFISNHEFAKHVLSFKVIFECQPKLLTVVI